MMIEVFRILLYTSIVPLVVGGLVYSAADHRVRLVYYVVIYEIARQLLLEFVLTKNTAWTTHFDAVVIPGLLIFALMPERLPVKISKKLASWFFVIAITGITLIDYLSNPDPARFNVTSNTIAACVIIVVAYFNLKYIVNHTQVPTRKDPMFIISIGCLIYFLGSVFFFSQTENVLGWSYESLMLFMIINKAFYVIALITPITIGFIRVKW